MSTIEDIQTTAGEIAKALVAVKGEGAERDAKISEIAEKIKGMELAAYKAQVERDQSRPLGDQERALDVYSARYVGDDEVRTRSQHYREGIRLFGYEENGVQKFGVFDDPSPRTDWQREAQRALSIRNLVAHAMGGGRNSNSAGRINGDGTYRSDRAEKAFRAALGAAPLGISKIFANSTGIGSEYIPSNLMPEVERRIEYMPSLAQMFETDVIAGDTQKRSFIAGNIRPYLEQIPTTDNPANAQAYVPGSAQNTLSTKAFAASGQFHLDAIEDAIINEFDEFSMQLARGFGIGRDDAIINGDTTTTHQDAIATWNPRGIYGTTTGAGGSLDHRRAWKGLRRLAVDKSTTVDQSATQTAAGAVTLAATLDPKFYAQIGPDQPVVYLVSPEYALRTMVTFVDSYDKVGVMAALISGLLPGANSTALGAGPLPGWLGNLYGRAVCMTWALTADLATTGLYTGTGAYTGMLAVYRPSFRNVQRKGLTIQAQDNIANNTRLVVGRARFGFRETQGTTDKTVAFGYKLTS